MSDMVKWDPFKHVARLYEDVDSLFTEFLKTFSEEFHSVKMSKSNLKVEVQDKGNEIVITGEIPNAVKDSVDVALRPESVLVSGETSEKKHNEGANEFSWSKFTRILSLPAKVNTENANVTFENGKLIIRVPKAK